MLQYCAILMCMKFAEGIDYTLAHAGSMLSWASVHNRYLGRMVIGEDPAITRLVYRVAATPAAEITTWAHFEGITGATSLPFPARYPKVGLVHVDNTAIHELEAAHPAGERAIAWKFGHAVLYGLLSPDDDIPDIYGMRIAGKPLDTTPVMHDPKTNQVFAPAYNIDAGLVRDVADVRGSVPIY